MVIRRRRSIHELRDATPSTRVFDKIAKKLPILDWAPLYSIAKFRSDVIAGLTVGLMVVPQSLAYATNIAELPARYGLYSSYVGVIIYMFFGTSKDVTLGPTAIMSKIVEQGVGSGKAECSVYGNAFKSISECPKLLGTEAYKCCDSVEKAAKLCIIGGVLNFLMGFLSLGFIVNFISLPVLYGFTTSASLTIAAGQVHSLIGIKGSKSAYPHMPDIFSKFANIFKDTFTTIDVKDSDGHHSFGWKYPDILMAAACILLTIMLQKLKAKMDKIEKPSPIGRFLWFLGAAGNFFTVAFGTVVAYIVHEVNKDVPCFGSCSKTLKEPNAHLTLTGHIPPNLPHPTVPEFKTSDIGSLMSGAILVALIGYLESIAIAKAFARSNGYEVDSSQELVAIGSSNIVSGFFQSYPVTGSFSRTAVNSASSVSTPLSGVITGTVVIIALEVMTSLMAYIPKASLGAIVIVSVLKMFNYKIVLKIWKVNKIELIPWAISFFGCTFLSIEYGVGCGALVNLLMFLGGGHAKCSLKTRFPVTDMKAKVIQIDGSVMYPSCASWKDCVRDLLDDPSTQAVVLDFAAVKKLDYTALQTLSEITEDCTKSDIPMELANVSLNIEDMLIKAGYFLVFDKSPESCRGCVEDVVPIALRKADDRGAAPFGSESTPLLSVNQ